jgi:hypothetical protein
LERRVPRHRLGDDDGFGEFGLRRHIVPVLDEIRAADPPFR